MAQKITITLEDGPQGRVRVNIVWEPPANIKWLSKPRLKKWPAVQRCFVSVIDAIDDWKFLNESPEREVVVTMEAPKQKKYGQ